MKVLRAHKGFGTRSVRQLHVIRGRRLLLSLSDDGVNLHSLPETLLKGQADRCGPSAPAQPASAREGQAQRPPHADTLGAGCQR